MPLEHPPQQVQFNSIPFQGWLYRLTQTVNDLVNGSSSSSSGSGSSSSRTLNTTTYYWANF